MSAVVRAAPCILVASDNSADAAMVKKLLGDEFDNIELTIDPDKAVEDFDRKAPDVLVLAFNALDKAERFYLGLYRLSARVHSKPHRTVILCGKDEVKKVSELCMKQLFDDYVLFWPMNYDAPRLPMAVHLAMRQLNALRDAGPSAAEFAAQARRLVELESLLEKQLTQGGRRIEGAARAVDDAGAGISAALSGLTQRLGSGALADLVDVKDATGLGQEIARMKRDEIDGYLRVAAENVKPLKQWVDALREDAAPPLHAARALSAMADRVRPCVLLVDDDEFQCKMVKRLLEAQNYQVECADSGLAALGSLRQLRPDAILMDLQMPGMDGIETMRRLKAAPHLATIPVIMLTGQSEGNFVVESIRAGASDFIVKPFDKEKLLAKVARVIGGTAVPRVAA